MADQMLKVSDFGRDSYGMTGAPRQAMINYGKVLPAIAGADGTVSPAEYEWLPAQQREFGAPDDVVLALHALVDMEKAVYDMRAALFHVAVIDDWPVCPSARQLAAVPVPVAPASPAAETAGTTSGLSRAE